MEQLNRYSDSRFAPLSVAPSSDTINCQSSQGSPESPGRNCHNTSSDKSTPGDQKAIVAQEFESQVMVGQ